MFFSSESLKEVGGVFFFPSKKRSSSGGRERERLTRGHAVLLPDGENTRSNFNLHKHEIEHKGTKHFSVCKALLIIVTRYLKIHLNE